MNERLVDVAMWTLIAGRIYLFSQQKSRGSWPDGMFLSARRFAAKLLAIPAAKAIFSAALEIRNYDLSRKIC